MENRLGFCVNKDRICQLRARIAVAVVIGVVMACPVGGRAAQINRNPRVVAYYPYYRSGGLPIEDIRYNALTNIIYFSLSVYENGDLDTSHIRFGDQAQLVSLAHSQGVEAQICVTGFSSVFGIMAADPVARSSFAQKITQYCLDYGLDGVDLDWEQAYSDDDRHNYSVLVRELNGLLKAHDMLLTAAVYPVGDDLMPWAIEYVDWLNVMVYNFGHPHSTFQHAVRSLNHWAEYGAPRAKLMLGIPFYGGDGERTYSYRNIMDTHQPAPDIDEIAGISFNGIDTVRQKTSYAMNTGHAGVMIWELSHDTQDDTSLLRAIDEEIDKTIDDSYTRILIPPYQVSATASSGHASYPDPMDVVDRTGMINEFEHSSSRGSWFTDGVELDRWIVVDLGGTYTLTEVQVWNANEAWGWNRYDFKETDIFVSTVPDPGNPVDHPENWTLAANVILTQADGVLGVNSPATDVIDLRGYRASHVALCALSTHKVGWGTAAAGLSELQFYSVGLRGDLDRDADVDPDDLWILSDNWLGDPDTVVDINGDGRVGIVELSILAGEWLMGAD